MFSFTINHKENQTNARTGTITTANGSFQTPTLVPVATQAAIKALTPQQLQELNYEVTLANTYHLYLRPGHKIVQNQGGLAKFMGWNKPTFTDSGGFQVFSLQGGLVKVDDQGVTFKSYIDQSTHRFTPELSMQIQHQLGADIIFTFDDVIRYDATRERTVQAMNRTHEWTKRFIQEYEKLGSTQTIFGIVQGGRFDDLRIESAKFIASLNFPGFGIGGIFGDPKKESQKTVKKVLDHLPYEKPKHMLGIGSVDDIFYYTQLGADTFDCVLPTRLAREGYVFIGPNSGGTKENKFRYRVIKEIYKNDPDPIDKSCECYTCKTFSRSYIRHLYKANELLFYQLTTIHNLHFFAQLLKQIRESINTDTSLELKTQWLKNQ